MKTPVRLMVVSSRALVRMRDALIRLGRAPVYTGEPYFGPYVDALRRIAEEHGLDLAGVEAGQEFAQLWDERSREFIEQRVPRLYFSDEEEERLVGLLREFGGWVTRSFPEDIEGI